MTDRAPHLYAIRLTDAPVIKIGQTSKVKHRLLSIINAQPFAAEVHRVFRFRDPRLASGYEHAICAAGQRVGPRREWLQHTPAIDAALDAIQGAEDVTADFRRIIAPVRGYDAARADRELADAKAAIPAAVGAAPPFTGSVVLRNRLIREALWDGLGADDVLVRYGIPRCAYWAEVKRQERAAA